MSSSPPAEAAGLDRLLRVAVAGDLEEWEPLPAGLRRAELGDLLPARSEPDLTVLLGAPAAGYRVGESAAAPTGVIVWTQHEEVTLLEVRGPEVSAEAVAALGAAEAALPSGLSDAFDQLVWPERGLILHRARATGRVHRAYGFPFTPLDQLLGSPLVAVAEHRRVR